MLEFSEWTKTQGMVFKKIWFLKKSVMNVYNTATLKLWNFIGRFQFKLWFLLSVLNNFTVDTEEYPIGVSSRVNDAMTPKTSYHHCSSQIIYVESDDWLQPKPG